MKILHIITSLQTGGAEKLMVDLLPRLRDMGNEVELLLFDGTRTAFYDELESFGINIYSFSIGGYVYNPLNIFRLRKFLKNYDIIHTHNTACQYYVAIASRLNKAKLITTEHNTHNRRRDIFGFKYIDRYIYKQYNHIISISQKANENLQNYIGYKYPCTTIHNGINISLYYNKKTIIPMADNEIIIAMVAGFRPQKDQDTLIKAISCLPNNYKLWLIGDGERRGEIECLISHFKLSERIKLWGIRNDIPELLAQSHIVVLSSHWEGLSLSSIEGMASGRPFIASDVDGLHDIVKDAGILFPHKNYLALAKEIKSLCEDISLYKTIAQQCQERAKDYDINIMAEKYNQLYNSLFQ